MDRQPTCTNCGKHVPYLVEVKRNDQCTDECTDCAVDAVMYALDNNERVSVNGMAHTNVT